MLNLFLLLALVLRKQALCPAAAAVTATTNRQLRGLTHSQDGAASLALQADTSLPLWLAAATGQYQTPLQGAGAPTVSAAVVQRPSIPIASLLNQSGSSPFLLAAATGRSPASLQATSAQGIRFTARQTSSSAVGLSGSSTVGTTTGYGTAGGGLGDIAIGLISGRPTYWSNLHAAVLRHTARGMILKSPGKCNCGFVAGFQALRSAQPDAKWYYVGDEDAFIFLDRLAELVSHHDPKLPTAIAMLGTHPAYERICGAASPIQGTITELGSLTFYGGTGIILSSALVDRIDWNRPCKRGGHVAADRDVTCHIGASWKPSYRYVSLKALKGPGDQPNASAALDQVVAVHHLAPSDFEKKASWNAHLGGAEPLRLIDLASNHGCSG